MRNALIQFVVAALSTACFAVTFQVPRRHMVACGLGGNAIREKSAYSLTIMIAAFVCDFFLGVNVICIILAAAVIGILRLWLIHRQRRAKA